MCGISGVIGHEPGRSNLDLLGPIEFRGRDSSGIWAGDIGVRLGHTRLAIIDPHGGAQPMVSHCGNFVITFNGTIYNYVEIRERLKALGGEFHTQSDTEVILEGYRIMGNRVFPELNGAFALGIWDRRQRELTLVRDRLGKKPLFWRVLNDCLEFGSSLNLFVDAGKNIELNNSAILNAALFNSFVGDETIYSDVKSLLPASILKFEQGVGASPEIQRYWALDFDRKHRSSLRSSLWEYREILTDALEIRLRSDVPIGMTFSGGVDSGTLAALVSQDLERPMKYFTIDYDSVADPSREVAASRSVAATLGLDWRLIQFDYHTQMLDGLDAAYRPYDAPTAKMDIVFVDLLYRALADHVKVVLSGNGADEIFMGYSHDHRIRAASQLGLLARPLRTLSRRSSRLSRIAADPLTAWSLGMAHELNKLDVDEGALASLQAAVARIVAEMRSHGVRDRIDIATYLRLRYYGADANFRVPDISGYNAGIEVRSPFLDHRVVEFAAALPARWKTRRILGGKNKFLPKVLYASFVGRELAFEPKRGMAANIRWNESIWKDATYRRAFLESYDALDSCGVGSQWARRSWESYLQRSAAGQPPGSPDAMMTGFMVGRWLLRHQK